MADRPSGSEFEATVQDLSGGGNHFSASLPPYVLDKTVRDVMEGLVKAISSSAGENAKDLQDLADHYKTIMQESDSKRSEQSDDLVEETKEQTKVLLQKDAEEKQRLSQEKEDRKKHREKMASAIHDGAIKGGRFGGDLLVSAIKGMAVIFGTAGGIMLSSFTNLGNGLRTLTDTGQSFGDQLSIGTSSTTENITALNMMGFTTEEAVSSLAEYSRAMSTMGQSTLIGLNKQFLMMTQGGATLGVTLDEASEFFLQDQQFRARTLNKDRIDQSITAQLTVKSINNLRGFSSILGQSTDALRQQSEGIMDGNKTFQAFTNTLNPAKATEMLAVARSVVEGLVAVFPTAGRDLGDALLTVAGSGVGAISDFANMLIPLGGTLYSSFQTLAGDLRSGSITMEEVPKAIQGIVDSSSMNVAQLDQLRVIAGLEGHAMQGVAQTIVQMQQDASMARQRLEKLADSTGMQYDTIQTTTVGFENIMKTLKGGYSSLLNSIPIEATKVLGTRFENFLHTINDPTGGISVLNKALQNAGVNIGKAIGETLDALAPDGDYGKLMTDIINGLVDLTTYFVKKVENIIKALRGQDGTIDFMGVLTTFFVEAIGLMLTAFVNAVGALFTLENAGTLFKLGGIYLAFVAVTGTIGALFSIMIAKVGAQFSMAIATASVGGGMGGFFGGKGGFLKGAGNMAMRAAPYLAAGMVAKDGFDVVAGTDGGANKENTYGLVGGTLGGIIGAGIGAFFGGVGAVPGAAIGASIGNMAGNFFGGRADEEKTQNPKRQAQIVSPNMQGPTTSNLSTRYLDSMTDVSTAGSSIMTSQEINALDKETPETKALALILAENKTFNRKLQTIIAEGIKTKAGTRGDA